MTRLERGLGPAIELGLEAMPVVVVEGGRAVGKSTLCQLLAARHGWSDLVDLSDPGTLELVRLDAERLLSDSDTTVVIDEAQLEPSLLLAIKRIVDRRAGVPGQFLLTGSARLGRSQLGGSDPLAGRCTRVRLWSLTEGERRGHPTPLAATLFAGDAPFEPGHERPRSTGEPWWRGGLPAIPGVLRDADGGTWERAMATYVESVLPLGTAGSRADLGRLLRTFRYLAANPGQQLVMSRAASELGMKADTVRSHIEALDAAFLLTTAQAHRPSEHKVLTAHPRTFACDTGLAAWAMGLGSRPPTPLERGSLMENRVAIELAATLDWTSSRIVLRHWRDRRSKKEVDLLLVHADGRAVPIEVKSANAVGPADAAGLSAFAAENRDRFHRGFVVYDGNRVLDLSPSHLPNRSILAVPFDTLVAEPR